ncbi:MAG: DUF3833 domain-containing protein [Gammaproteobacteria bacterium]|nr:DUF3833 domain-containing protein [Gammaproteobacteria bacterium]
MIQSLHAWVVSLVSLVLLAGCAGMDAQSYREQSPEFVLEEFFDGTVKAWGIVQNRDGDVVQRFTVDIDGSFADDQLVLDETFTYGLGEGVEKRIWTIQRLSDGRYTGSADDVLPGAAGRSWGNAFNWRYKMDLPVGDRQYRVNFNDWIWALDDSTIVNRAYIRKFGLTFAEVTLFMQRQ